MLKSDFAEGITFHIIVDKISQGEEVDRILRHLDRIVLGSWGIVHSCNIDGDGVAFAGVFLTVKNFKLKGGISCTKFMGISQELQLGNVCRDDLLISCYGSFTTAYGTIIIGIHPECSLRHNLEPKVIQILKFHIGIGEVGIFKDINNVLGSRNGGITTNRHIVDCIHPNGHGCTVVAESCAIIHFELEGGISGAIAIGIRQELQQWNVSKEYLCIVDQVGLRIIDRITVIQINPESSSGGFLDTDFVESVILSIGVSEVG